MFGRPSGGTSGTSDLVFSPLVPTARASQAAPSEGFLPSGGEGRGAAPRVGTAASSAPATSLQSTAAGSRSSAMAGSMASVSAPDLAEYQRLRDELETVKVATMHNMVSKLSMDIQDTQVEVNALYLTNTQAAAVETKSMPEVRNQLGITDPKMVIRLMPSHFGSAYWKSFPYFCGRFPTKDIPEVSDEMQERTEHQLILLAKDVLLPLASRTRSLVIGSESCALTAAFVQVSAPFQRQLGDACPFRLLIFARAQYYFMTSLQHDTVANHVRHGCKAWADTDMTDAISRTYGEDRAFWPAEDFPTGKYSLIIFECMGPEGLAAEISQNFSNDFISSLSVELPVIALQTYGTNKMNMVPALAEHVTRGLPLMLLDSRPRHITSSLHDAADEIHQLSVALHTTERGPRSDAYFTSTLAFVKGTLDSKNVVAVQAPDADTAFQAPVDEDRQDHDMWIWETIEQRLIESGPTSSGNGSVATADEAGKVAASDELMAATNLVMSSVGFELEWESKELQARCEAGIMNVIQAETWQDFAQRLRDNWCAIRGCCFHMFGEARLFARANPWITLDEDCKLSAMGEKVLKIVFDGDGFDYSSEEAFINAKKRLGDLFFEALQRSKDYDEVAKSRKSFVANHDLWLAVYDILKAPNVHTGNLHQLDHVNGTLFSLAQIDRLPTKNTLEALVLLRAAWTLIDVYNDSAMTYKVYSKLTYFGALILGVATVAFTVMCSIYGNITTEDKRVVLLAFSLVGSCLTGYTALVDPSRKWMQLRNGAYTLEAEVWKFRARVGEYAGSTNATTHHGRMLDERRAEAQLQQAILQVQGRIRLSTGLKETSFYAVTVATDDLQKVEPQQDRASRDRLAPTTSSPNLLSMSSQKFRPSKTQELAKSRAHLRHGQYRGKDAKPLSPGQDSCHAPAKPEDYIRWRLVPKMQFYQKRIPKYACRRRTFQAIILLSSLATSLLAALGESQWTAIIASISSAVAGWQEFVDVAKKLQRYSGISAHLGNIMVWWQALTEVEQAMVKNVSALVDQTEKLLGDERSAWVSDAQAASLKLQGSGAADKKKGGESPGGGGGG